MGKASSGNRDHANVRVPPPQRRSQSINYHRQTLKSMPPKQEITIVKFKRARSTYVASLILNQKKNLTLKHFVDTLVEAINSSGGLRVIESSEGAAEEGIQVSSEEIELAYPKARDTPYANEWIPIADDSAIESTVMNDYDVIGFKYADDADFNIEQPVYEEA